MGESWNGSIRGAPASGHAVELYSDVEELAASVAGWFAEGLVRGEPAIAVARAPLLDRVSELLAARAFDVAELRSTGRFVVADAETTLASIMHGGEPRADAFDDVVGGLLDGVAASLEGERPRVFGEMVDVLVQRSEPVAAVALEELWNDLASRRDFDLLCGYRVDVFDRETQSTLLPDVCRVHSRVRPAHDTQRFAKAVDWALEDVLGAAGAGQVYVLVGGEVRADRVPAPQLVLMWVSEHMPLLAERILAAARGRYLDMPAAEDVTAPSRQPPPGIDPRWRETLRDATRPTQTIFFRDN